MQYIKTPIKSDYDEVRDADDHLFAIGMGTNPNAVEQLQELALAVNQHDDLVAQRDALVAACRLFTRAYYGNGGIDVNWELYDRAGIAALAALALVEGDQKSDDADQD